ncbi:TlpA disulfide reductase family protein [Bacteroides sp. 224]|uniref:TlpA disulfide reductase family protein n=1 Tax=Bacteroides sp. 224 TaxID=2302936 RepID=UPI0013D03CF7|nr:TlpA disulfide reductase family protein [Bacteroides sp. 224]NDV63769.1 AhpC/TSA family protein [Bacteroides sp. 224]
MKKISFLAFALLALVSCNSGSKFEVTGEISGAEGKKLYLEASKLEGVVALDSVKLKSNGSFTFKQDRPESPEFFRLRVDNKVINFSVDSIETIKVIAPYNEFSTAYTIEGSVNSKKIKELTVKQIALQNEINALAKSAQSNRMRNDIFEDSVLSIMNRYKEDVRVNYIYAAPNTAAAYFALFQKVNNFLIFDPLNSREDVRSFAAVATSLDANYPHAIRTRNLYNLVLKGMRNTRPAKEQVLEIPQEKIVETNIIDIDLKDLKGNSRKLTDLAGKVVLLDFTVYQSTVAAAHNFWLRDLYNKYAAQGLEVYQVSLDADEHFWKTSADNLPWVCVRDPRGVYSPTLNIYNVKQLPTYFLINKKNELKKRGEDIKDIEAEIKAML